MKYLLLYAPQLITKVVPYWSTPLTLLCQSAKDCVQRKHCSLGAVILHGVCKMVGILLALCVINRLL